MEAGNVGNGDRRDRRRTVSGAFPDFYHYEEEEDEVTPIETMRFPWTSSSTPTTPVTPSAATSTTQPPTKSSSGHRKTFSGTIFSKINFLRNNAGSEDGSPRNPTKEQRPVTKDKPTSPTKSVFSRKSVDDDPPASSPTSPSKADREKESALAAALKQSQKTRKRTGSLRKTALLGGRNIISGGRERKGSFVLLQRSASAAKKEVQQQQALRDTAVQEQIQSKQYADTFDGDQSSDHEDADAGPRDAKRQFSYDHAVAASSNDTAWSEPAAVSAARLSLLTDHRQQQIDPTGTRAPGTTVNELGSPIDVKSPTSNTSTTDDDDLLTFHHPAPTKPTPAPISTAYYPSTTSLSTRRLTSKRRSPLSRSTTFPTPSNTTQDPLYHDYTSTAYWGWIILFSTWVTFTVGMGSCLGIWSWAWDVGETPRAPPDLEDDPTLPIVGYYPALMVLTGGVVVWAWITVAWVGMKYFRHAKIEV